MKNHEMSMKNRNIYKDMVTVTVLCVLAVVLVRMGKSYMQEQKSYGFTIQSEKELTQEVVKEFQNISGICRFEPVDTVPITIKLQEYTMETNLTGVDLKEYPLKWEEAEEKTVLGNTSALFFGKNSFQSFADKNGHSPGKNQIKTWIGQYSEITLTITDETGRVRKAKISGILKESENRIYMDKTQMEQIFPDSVHTTGGYMEIYGYQNSKKAKELLESSGFTVE